MGFVVVLDVNPLFDLGLAIFGQNVFVCALLEIELQTVQLIEIDGEEVIGKELTLIILDFFEGKHLFFNIWSSDISS